MKFYCVCYLVGESARRPIGNLYKLDGKTGTVYSGREGETSRIRRGKGPESSDRGTEGDQISHRKGGSKGVSRQMEQNVEVCVPVHYIYSWKQMSHLFPSCRHYTCEKRNC